MCTTCLPGTHQIPWNWSYRYDHEGWELNPGLQEQQVLLTNEPLIQPHSHLGLALPPECWDYRYISPCPAGNLTFGDSI